MFQFPTPAGFANGETALEPQFDSEAAADLWGAAQVLRKHGHTKRMIWDPSTGRMCLGGALNYHIQGQAHVWGSARFQSAVLLLGEAVLGPDGNLPFSYHLTIDKLVEWNNAVDTSAEEVIDALERTAAAHALPAVAPAG